MKVWQLMLSGLVVHLILFYSIFDIYFTSPLVHGMTPSVPDSPAPAKRLVLFVADGLRADRFFQQDRDREGRELYLRDVIQSRGSWGVSHTRVPTESRPGHVALIAGFYEDVSAVAKGWKENPVEFDSVFNESRYTWSWGSPDILPMFAKGATGDHVFTHCYSSAEEDFASFDASKLDTWVYQKVKKFLSVAKTNATLLHQLQQDKIVFFLHLLGLDTNGHSHKPHSREYIENIHLLNHGVEEMVSLFEDFYNQDGRTAYVMSADHGMTDWGSHGAGLPSETLTPLVAWGAGLHGPRGAGTCGTYPDTFCTDWNLNNIARFDVQQADVAPLMAYLIGVAFPMNSVGVLPLEYLGVSLWEQAEGIYANAQQILAQYQVKMRQVKERTVSVAFRPFGELSPSKQADYVRHIRQLIKSGNYAQAIAESRELMSVGLKGLNYYQKYDRLFLGISIVLSFVGWMVYLLQQVLHNHTWFCAGRSDRVASPLHYVHMAAAVMASIVSFLLFIQSSPVTYYLYCLLPVLLWTKVVEAEVRLQILKRAVSACYDNKCILAVTASVACSMLGLEIVVQGFFQRELLSVGLVCIALWSVTSGVFNTSKFSAYGWLLSCILLAAFPLLPVVGRNANYTLVLVSGMLAFLLGAVMVYRLGVLTSRDKNNNRMSGVIMGIQLVMILAAVGLVKTTSDGIRQRHGVPSYNHLISWAMLGLSPIWPLLTSTNLPERLASVGLTFIGPYILMSITYESVFLLVLLSLLYFWLHMEHDLAEERTRKLLSHTDFTANTHLKSHRDTSPDSRWLQLADLRRAFYFVFLTLTAFFGTGNIASINSFDPASVYCFLTVFNPFVMGALMLLKNVIPFLLVTCAFQAVHVVTRIPVRALFLLVMLMSDYMGLHFFFLVRDYGSWLEIGTSISHYVIVMTMIIFLMLLMGISHILTCCRLSFLQQKYHPG
ncbi:GPI ethanolamine phosphate transferase 1-like isoform X2 [Haliotis rufescens]|uniref:GPI ethanolamine phosphate transferase 1-like isoform X2 n=1 Tax=Haliotis rufescens TaxID=6454 RepID=UPI00201F7316|nr:GPI ethanolamine phosphate transferase 1-like isoform X2 [Haliotis rufescens]